MGSDVVSKESLGSNGSQKQAQMTDCILSSRGLLSSFQFRSSAGQQSVSGTVQCNSVSTDPDLQLKAYMMQVRSVET